MSVNIGKLSPDQLKKYVRMLSSGEILFEQGDLGNTLFIIISGSITLLEKRQDNIFVVGTLGSGQVIGEKALLTESPYRRVYTVRAETNATLLEFDNKNLKLVESIIPNFSSRILQMAAKRLDRANKIISLLRSLDPIERVISGISFLAEENGKTGNEGIEVNLDIDEIYALIYVSKEVIQDCIDLLTKNKIIRTHNGQRLIPDLNALKQFYPDLKERVAA